MAQFQLEDLGGSGFRISIPLWRGGTKVIYGYSKEVVLAKAERWLASNGSEVAREPVKRTYKDDKKPGRRKGMNAFYNIYGKIYNAAYAAAAVGSCYMTEEIASGMLKSVRSRVTKSITGYNRWSGNLENAYIATIVQGRNIAKMVKLPPVKGNKFLEGKVKIKIRRHDKRRDEKKKYRYKKFFERAEGYDGTGISAGRDRLGGFGYATGGDNRIQSGVIIENVAPYAGAVEARGYKVLPLGIERSFAGRAAARQKSLIISISNRMLKAARIK